MKPTLILVAAAVVLFATEQDSTKSTAKKQTDKNTTANKTKDADAWLEVFPKRGSSENTPTWPDVLAALEKRYGRGKVSCRIFDAARQKYFEDFVAPGAIKQGFGIETTREQFMKKTDLPTSWTITGRKRDGCVPE